MPTAQDDRVVRQFTRWAAAFAALPLHAEADGMRRLLDAADPTPDARVLDVACGPGIVACALAEWAGHVTGIDLTPAMLDAARARQARLGLANLTWRSGNAAELDVPSGSFDLVVTRYSFHHMSNPSQALAEMARACRPGGRIVVVDATPEPETQCAYDRMETLRDPSHTSALTLAQLRGLAAAIPGLTEIGHDFHRLEARIADIADAADLAALTTLFEADIASGEDSMGVAPWRADDGIRFRFPISILIWRRD